MITDAPMELDYAEFKNFKGIISPEHPEELDKLFLMRHPTSNPDQRKKAVDTLISQCTKLRESKIGPVLSTRSEEDVNLFWSTFCRDRIVEVEGATDIFKDPIADRSKKMLERIAALKGKDQ